MKSKVNLGKKLQIIKISWNFIKKLARIILDVPVKYKLTDFELSDPDNKSVMKIFDELEFRRMKEILIKYLDLKIPKVIFKN